MQLSQHSHIIASRPPATQRIESIDPSLPIQRCQLYHRNDESMLYSADLTMTI